MKSSKTIEVDIQTSTPNKLLLKDKPVLDKVVAPAVVVPAVVAPPLDNNLIEVQKNLIKEPVVPLAPGLEAEKEKLLLLAEKPALGMDPALSLDKKEKLALLEKDLLLKKEKELKKKELLAARSHVAPEDLDSQA